jgi:hypothetical protein
MMDKQTRKARQVWDIGKGSFPWITDINNISCKSTNTEVTLSNILAIGDFCFNIKNDSIITGIEVNVLVCSDSPHWSDNHVMICMNGDNVLSTRLIVNGSDMSNSLNFPIDQDGTKWIRKIYGGETNKWDVCGYMLDSNTINNMGFGFTFRFKNCNESHIGKLKDIEMTIYY